MGRKLDILLGRSWRQIAKLKTLLGLTVSRLAVLRNQRLARCSHARSDVAQLLDLGNHDRALLRTEQVIKEQNMLDAFVIIEGYCHLITERAALLERARECPEELREAASGLIFAASRCGDMPELLDVRYAFASKFGKEFAAAAVELRNNCRVSPKLIQKLSTKQPSLESKIKVAKEIAAEKGITLDLVEPAAEEDPDLNQKQQQQQQSNPNTGVDLSGINLAQFQVNGEQKYKDAATAAQVAFESAAFAAAAARAAVELSRSEFHGKGPDDQNAGGDGGIGVEELKEDTGFKNNKTAQNYSSESEEELPQEQSHKLGSDKPGVWLEKSPSASSLESIETPVFEKISFDTAKKDARSDRETQEQDWYQESVLGYNGERRERKQFEAVMDEEPPVKQKPSYLNPPYRKGNAVRHGVDSHGAFHDDKENSGFAPRNEDDHVRYYSGGNFQAEEMHFQRSSAGQAPISMRTRRGV